MAVDKKFCLDRKWETRFRWLLAKKWILVWLIADCIEGFSCKRRDGLDISSKYFTISECPQFLARSLAVCVCVCVFEGLKMIYVK